MVTELSKQNVLDFLVENPVLNLSAVGEGGVPISTVLLFSVDNDFTFTFCTHSDSHKYEALLSNPVVSFTVWVHNKMLVQADGLVELQEDDPKPHIEKLIASTKNIEKFWPPLLRLSKHNYVVFKITTTWLRALDLSDPTISDVKTPYKVIIDRKYEKTADR